MKRRLVEIFLALAAGGLFAAPQDEEVIPQRQDHLPNQPYSPQEAVGRMTVPEGFHVDLVASEPEIVNPIAMTFDDRGRLWITESVEYPRKSAGPGRDRVKIIEGFGPDGRASNVTTFAEGLNIPTGIAVGYGGAWVLNAPDLLFFQEKEGRQASREVVLTGFGRTDTHELPSSLTWGPDGWLYGLNGVFNQSKVLSKDGKQHDFTCAMWRLDPKTREFQVFARGTSNPYGIAWDQEGSAIIEVCHWSNDHLFHFVETGYYQRQAGAYPPFAMIIPSITDHGHQKTAYCGISILETGLFPEKYRGRVCVGNIHGGCINVDRLERDGSSYLAKGEPDLLTAHDDWFMPVALKIGPDGCLYILDWYDRYHCSQDAARDPQGVDRLRGRLYRLRYGGARQARKFDLAAENDDQLVSRLSDRNIFFRETAQRILTERLREVSVPASDPVPAAGITPLRNTLRTIILDEKSSRSARLQALWTLIGGGWIEPELHQKLLAHSDPAVRAWAVRAAGNRGNVSPEIRNEVVAMARDPSPDVQLQVAIASRKIEGCDALPLLVDVLLHCGQDKLIPAIVWPNLHPLLETESTRFTAQLKLEAASPGSTIAPAVAALLPRIIDRILSARAPGVDAVAGLLELATRRNEARGPDCVAAISAKLDGLSDTTQARLKEQLRPVMETILQAKGATPLKFSAQLLAGRLGLASVDAAGVRERFLSASEPESTRIEALEALIAFHDRGLLDVLPQVFSAAQSSFLVRVLATLGRVEDSRLAEVILAQYPQIPLQQQPLAIDLLMQREPWAWKLLNAVLAGKLPKSVLNANHLRKIMESDDREAIWAVEKAFGKVREERNPEREKVVAEMGGYLRGNIGDPIAGAKVFRNFCAQCHTIYGDGGRVGPDITANGRSSFDQLLSNVFDPSLVIGPDYQVTTVVTSDGRSLTGLIAENSDQRVVVRLPGEGEEVVPRNKVKYTHVSKLSMMPEGIENLLSKRDLADLFAFLSFDKPPADPTARLIPGAPDVKASRTSGLQDARIRVERSADRLQIRSRLRPEDPWIDLASYVMEPGLRPYLHPVHDPSGRVVLTEDHPDDHPWQHGIFTGFHRVNGFNYWKEDQGKQHFERLLDLKEETDRVSWRALVRFIAPDGRPVLEEEDAITIHAPESTNSYVIDFDLLLRAKEETVNFGKFFVGGLSVRMPWDKARPRQTHLNSNGLRGLEGEQKRADWCTVERPFGGESFGFAVFDHPANPNHPSFWRVDEQGLINPNVSGLADWSIPAKEERLFRYQILVCRGATAEQLSAQFRSFAGSSSGAASIRH
jgi:putative membrane-bound dehydrogenase-like protein